jgi:hypothetical protein
MSPISHGLFLIEYLVRNRFDYICHISFTNNNGYEVKINSCSANIQKQAAAELCQAAAELCQDGPYFGWPVWHIGGCLKI